MSVTTATGLEPTRAVEDVEASRVVSIRLADGRSVLARRAMADDGGSIIELYAGLSAESRYTRFFQLAPIKGPLRRHLLDLDRGPIWMAFDGARCVGEVRMVWSTRERCVELAVTIADDFQHAGLGRRLTKVALAHDDPGCLSVVILPENTAAARLARGRGMKLHFDSGVLEGRWERPALAT